MQLPVERFCCVRWTVTSPGPHTRFLGKRVTFTVMHFYFFSSTSVLGSSLGPGPSVKRSLLYDSPLWLAGRLTPCRWQAFKAKTVNNTQATAADLFFSFAVNRRWDGPSDRWSDLRLVCCVSHRKYASAQVQWNEEQMCTVNSGRCGGG